LISSSLLAAVVAALKEPAVGPPVPSSRLARLTPAQFGSVRTALARVAQPVRPAAVAALEVEAGPLPVD